MASLTRAPTAVIIGIPSTTSIFGISDEIVTPPPAMTRRSVRCLQSCVNLTIVSDKEPVDKSSTCSSLVKLSDSEDTVSMLFSKRYSWNFFVTVSEYGEIRDIFFVF